MINP
jgi:hypothetical protein